MVRSLSEELPTVWTGSVIGSTFLETVWGRYIRAKNNSWSRYRVVPLPGQRLLRERG